MTVSKLDKDLKCHECGRKTAGTMLREQFPHTPDDPSFFRAPLCDRQVCRDSARAKGAQFR